MIGRRVQSLDELQFPGDYVGPIHLRTAGPDGVESEDPVERCFFRLPVEIEDMPGPVPHHLLSVYSVAFPPHVYRECDDGSLEIRESIGCYGGGPELEVGKFIWHGYLDEGHIWRTA